MFAKHTGRVGPAAYRWLGQESDYDDSFVALIYYSYGERVRTDVERAGWSVGANGEDEWRDAFGRWQLAAAAAAENVPKTIGYTKTFINEPHQSVTDGPDGPYVQPGRFAQATSSE